MAWKISGEAGKAMDATQRTLAALKIAGTARLRFESLGADLFQWTAITQDLVAGETILPEAGQVVEVFNDAGARVFRGHVTDPQRQAYGTNVTVQGPWWWLQQVDLNGSLIDDAGNTGTRPSFRFPEQTVTASLTAVVNRAIASGVPIALGTIDATFTVMLLQMSIMTFADALAELLRWLPDATLWFDYSGAGLPKLNITRRDNAAAVNYALPADVTGYSVTPRTQLRAKRVELHYMERNAGTGEAEFKVQSAGAAGVGGLQMVALSGKELDTYIPPDDFESYTIQTYPANLSDAQVLSILEEVKKSRAEFGGMPATYEDITVARGETVVFNSSTGGPAQGTRSYRRPSLTVADPVSGNPVNLSGKYFLRSEDPPDWAKDAITLIPVKLQGMLYRLEPLVAYRTSGSGAASVSIEAVPEWAQAFPWAAQYVGEGYRDNTTHMPSFSYGMATWRICEFPFSIDAFLTTVNYSAGASLFKPFDYVWLKPPAGLAAALLAAQNWIPYAGTISRTRQAQVDGANLLNKKFNLSGAQADLATMGALPKAITYDLATRSVDIELGPPARQDFRTLSRRFRVTPQTNITFL